MPSEPKTVVEAVLGMVMTFRYLSNRYRQMIREP